MQRDHRMPKSSKSVRRLDVGDETVMNEEQYVFSHRSRATRSIKADARKQGYTR